MTEVEEAIARQDQVVAELQEMRLAALDPRTKEYLREQECNAREVLRWLIGLRREMWGEPPTQGDE